jgi:hypothetical protein
MLADPDMIWHTGLEPGELRVTGLRPTAPLSGHLGQMPSRPAVLQNQRPGPLSSARLARFGIIGLEAFLQSSSRLSASRFATPSAFFCGKLGLFVSKVSLYEKSNWAPRETLCGSPRKSAVSTTNRVAETRRNAGRTARRSQHPARSRTGTQTGRATPARLPPHRPSTAASDA